MGTRNPIPPSGARLLCKDRLLAAESLQHSGGALGIQQLTPKPQNPVSFLFGKVLGGLKHAGGILDMVGTILADDEPEWKCVTLKPSAFHDFCPDPGILTSLWIPI